MKRTMALWKRKEPRSVVDTSSAARGHDPDRTGEIPGPNNTARIPLAEQPQQGPPSYDRREFLRRWGPPVAVTTAALAVAGKVGWDIGGDLFDAQNPPGPALPSQSGVGSMGGSPSPSESPSTAPSTSPTAEQTQAPGPQRTTQAPQQTQEPAPQPQPTTQAPKPPTPSRVSVGSGYAIEGFGGQLRVTTPGGGSVPNYIALVAVGSGDSPRNPSNFNDVLTNTSTQNGVYNSLHNPANTVFAVADLRRIGSGDSPILSRRFNMKPANGTNRIPGNSFDLVEYGSNTNLGTVVANGVTQGLSGASTGNSAGR